jgi:hypothetical protein
MRATRVVPVLAAATLLVAAGAAAASNGSAPRVGYYAPLGTTVGSADVELFAIDDGTRIGDTALGDQKGDYSIGLSCTLDPAEQSEGLNPAAAYVNVYVPLGLKIPIKGDKFSYSGPAYLPAFEIPAGVTQPAGTITLQGTFKPGKQIKGKHVDKKTVALNGTVSATLCPAGPTVFTDYWSKTD